MIRRGLLRQAGCSPGVDSPCDPDHIVGLFRTAKKQNAVAPASSASMSTRLDVFPMTMSKVAEST